MNKKRFQNIVPIKKELAEDIFNSKDNIAICNAMVAIAFYEHDWRWAQDRFLELFNRDNIQICCLAATCLGHIARIHGKIEKDKVLLAFNTRKNDPEISNCISDAMDDIKLFIKH